MTRTTQYNQYYRAGVGEAMGAAYRPAMMEFDGSSGYYQLRSSLNWGSAAGITVVAKFRRSPFTGAGFECIARLEDPNISRCRLLVISSDYATAELRNKIQYDIFLTGSPYTTSVRILSNVEVCDGEEHTIFISYNPSTASLIFIIDGQAADDTSYSSRLLNTSTFTTGIGYGGYLGSDNNAYHFEGDTGFFGCDDQYLTNWSDFMHINGSPIKQDESTWANSGWGAQPLLWNEHGEMSNNQGSAGDMTENGTIVVAPTEVPA